MEEGVARRLLADLAYRSGELREALAEVNILLVTKPSERRQGVRQQVEIALSSLKRVFGLGGTLATTLSGGAGHEDRGQDDCLHLRFLRQPPPGSSAGANQGPVGLKTSQQTSWPSRVATSSFAS